MTKRWMIEMVTREKEESARNNVAESKGEVISEKEPLTKKECKEIIYSEPERHNQWIDHAAFPWLDG